MSSQNIRKMVTTAILIALTLVFQLLRPVLGGTNMASTYIIGSLVNLCLIIAACVVGFWSGCAIAVIAPLIALWQGHAQLPMLHWVMLGNLVLVIIYALAGQKDKTTLAIKWPRWITAGIIAAVLKFIVMALGQATILAPKNSIPFVTALSTTAANQVVQLVTALIAMVLAGMIIPMLPAATTGKKKS